MNYANNWIRPITLGAGATSLALDLADGTYRLTLADSQAAATRWEIVDAEVEGGTATLTRGREGTLDQAWPEGSVIYNAVTAGGLTGIVSRIAALEAGGGGGSGGAIIAENPPGEDDIPEAVGKFYSVSGVGLWISRGTEFGSDWMPFTPMQSWGFGYSPSLPGSSYTAPYSERNLRVEMSSPFSGTYPATLVMPWIGQPYGLSIEIVPEGADAIALSLDFSLMGSQAYVDIENKGVANVVLVVDGGIVTVTVDEPCKLTLAGYWREDGDFGLQFLLEPVTPSTYIWWYPE